MNYRLLRNQEDDNLEKTDLKCNKKNTEHPKTTDKI